MFSSVTTHSVIWLDIEVVIFQYLFWNFHISSSAISVFNLNEKGMNYTNAIYADINLTTQTVYFNQCQLVIYPHLSVCLFQLYSWLYPHSFLVVYALISITVFPGWRKCSICSMGTHTKKKWCYNGLAILIKTVWYVNWQQFYSLATVTQGLQKLKSHSDNGTMCSCTAVVALASNY